MSYRSIDDYLGPGETRFFSQGYRRVEYQVGEIMVTPADVAGPGIRAIAALAYPSDWSKKTANVDLRPHLSTVDALVLSAQLSEAHLTHAYGLDSVMRRKMQLCRVTLRAGTKPQEELVGVPLSAVLRETKPDSQGGFISVFDCAAGVMRARCEIKHQIGQQATAEGTYGSLEDVLGPAVSRYYGEGFKFRRQAIEDVRVDMDALHADATVRIESTQAGGIPTEGLEGNYQPSVSMIDCFVVNLQMVQVLMYEMDSIDRQNSNTLWMLQTVLEATTPYRPFGAPQAAHADIVEKHLLPLRGGMWRNVDIAGSYGGIDLRCSFAHELPAEVARGAA